MPRNTNRRVVTLGVAAIILAVSALAADKPRPAAVSSPGRSMLGKIAWLRIDTPSFTTFGEVPEARLRTIADRLETFRSALQALHPGSQASPRETFVYVFQDPARGGPFTPGAG